MNITDHELSMKQELKKSLVLRIASFTVAILAILVAVFLIITLGWLLWQAVRALFGLSADAYIKVVAALGALASVFAVIWSKHWERKQSIEQELRKQKTQIYEKLINFWFKFLSSPEDGTRPIETKDVVTFVAELSPQMISWSSDDVIKAWSDLKNPRPDNSNTQAAIRPLLSFERLLFAIRRDLGHKNKSLQTGDLLSVFVTDIHENLKKAGVNVKRR